MDWRLVLTIVGLILGTTAVSIAAITIMFNMYRDIMRQTNETNTKLAAFQSKIEEVNTAVANNSERIDELSDSFNEKFGEVNARAATFEGMVITNSQTIGSVQSDMHIARAEMREAIERFRSEIQFGNKGIDV